MLLEIRAYHYHLMCAALEGQDVMDVPEKSLAAPVPADCTRIPFETTFKAIATRAALPHTAVSIMNRIAWDNEFSGPAAYV